MLRIVIGILGLAICLCYATAAILFVVGVFKKMTERMSSAIGVLSVIGWFGVFFLMMVGLVVKGSFGLLALGISALILPLLPGLLKPNEKPDKPWLMALCIVALGVGWLLGIALFFAVK